MPELRTGVGGFGGEGHVTGRASGGLAPVLEEASVAESHQRRRFEAEPGAGCVDPLRRAFQFGEGADGRFVEDAMAGFVGVFGAPLLVDKDRLVAKLGEDHAERLAIGDFGLGFDAAFVAGGGIVVGGHAFMGEQPAVSVAPNTKNGLTCTQPAVGHVVEGIAFKGARRDDLKAESPDSLLKVLEVLDAELNLGFDGAHGASIVARVRSAIMNRMRTLRLSVDADDLDSALSRGSIERAAAILREGGTVAFPTETVYGLGANALDPTAVAKIFAAKQRPKWDPLIVHLADRALLASITASVPENAVRLMDAFWPGPLTLLLRRSAAVPDAVTAGRPLVGVRVPRHPVAHALLKAAGVPVAAPSANRFGRTSPTLAAHVAEDLEGRIDGILDSGETTHGLESTVVDPAACVVYRPGVVTLEQIRAVCPEAVAFQESMALRDAEPESLPSPGVGVRHYAPRARLILIEGTGRELKERFVAVARSRRPGEKLGLMLPDDFQFQEAADALVYRWGAWANDEELAQRLFAGLRWLDAEGAAVILCPMPGAGGIGTAIRDRLTKAARE